MRDGDVVLLGGYPGQLREERLATADIAFQSIAGAATSVSESNVTLQVEFRELHWPNHRSKEFNQALGGMSGGPVFRFVPTPIERLELVAFIYEHQASFGLLLARPAQSVSMNGSLAKARAVV